MQAFRLAWRNVWRNPRRTAITGAAVILSTAITIMTVGLMAGIIQNAVDNTTNIALGEAQVHAPRYRAKRSFYDAIPNVAQILAAARRNGIDAAPRAFGAGLASVGSKSAGALYWGVELAAERAAFTLTEQVTAGRFLSPGRRRADAEGRPVREAVLGRRLARSLEARIGSELVAVVQAADGSIGNELFVVCGILKSVSDEVDRGAVIVHRADFDELFVAGGRVHEIALNSHGRLAPEALVAALKPAAGKMEALPWKKLNPTIAEWMKTEDAMLGLVGIVFYLSAALGVLNSMLMAVFERTREFGVIKALGGSPWRIVRDVCTEALLIGVVGAAIGAALGLAGGVYLSRVGIDLTRFGSLVFGGVAFDPIWRAVITPKIVIEPMIVMSIVVLVAGLYPAIRAGRLSPLRALNEP